MNNSIKKCDLSQRRKVRPAQMLYVPPAQRNKKKVETQLTNTINLEMNASEEETLKLNLKETSTVDMINDISLESSVVLDDTLSSESDNSASSNSNCLNSTNDEHLLIMLDNIQLVNEKNVDVEKAEMERAIVNINRKSRPLIKHINVGNKDVLHIDVDDKVLNVNKPRMIKKFDEVSNWEDLFNEDDEIMEQIVDYIDSKVEQPSDSDDEVEEVKNTGPNDLDHVIELYEFPSTFKTQDLIQLYHDVNNESMYIKWCDETHALLVLSTPAQAKKALQIHHDIIKSRTMINSSSIAAQVAMRCDLKPAMKRPETNMQTARRLINRHLGTQSKLSKEEMAKEREQLRKAKELKRAQRQCENDAWDGHPRPSTA